MKSKFRKVLRHQCDKPRIVGPGRYFGKPDIIPLNKKFDAVNTEAAQILYHRSCNLGRPIKSLLRHRVRLPGLTVVTVFLTVADRIAECNAVTMPYGQQRNLIIKVDEAFNNNPPPACTTAGLSIFPCGFNIRFRLDGTLALTGRTHHRLYNEWQPHLLDCHQVFLMAFSKPVWRCWQTQLFTRQAPNALTVHCQIHGPGCRYNVIALGFQLHQLSGCNSLNLRNDQIRLFGFNDCPKRLTIQHIDNMAPVCDLHGGRIGIAVNGYDFHAKSLQLNNNFFSELSGTTEKNTSCIGLKRCTDTHGVFANGHSGLHPVHVRFDTSSHVPLLFAVLHDAHHRSSRSSEVFRRQYADTRCKCRSHPKHTPIHRASEPYREPSPLKINLFQLCQIALCIENIVLRAHLQHFFLIVGQFAAYFPWRTDNHRSIWNLHTFRYQRVGTNKAVFPDLRAIQHYGIDPDQRIVANLAPVKHNLVPNGNASTDRQRNTGICVQYRAILNIGFRANGNQLVIAPNDHIEPDTGLLHHFHTTNHSGIVRNKLPLSDKFRGMAIKAIEHEFLQRTSGAAQECRYRHRTQHSGTQPEPRLTGPISDTAPTCSMARRAYCSKS